LKVVRSSCEISRTTKCRLVKVLIPWNGNRNMQQAIRVLLPWLPQAEAVSFLLGRVPHDGEDISEIVAIWHESCKRLERRPVVLKSTPVIQSVPDDLKGKVAELKSRPDLKRMFTELNWEVQIVDLHNLISFQKFITCDEIEQRVTKVRQDDWGGLFDLCLPQRSQQELPILLDKHNTAFTVSSSNPNLRIMNATYQDGLFQFQVEISNSLVQVVEYRKKLFLRDGYHRCYCLFRKNISQVPCLFTRVEEFQQLGAVGDAFFSYKILLGEKPPLLKDFLEDAYSRNVFRQATRKVIRISGQEFVVGV